MVKCIELFITCIVTLNPVFHMETLSQNILTARFEYDKGKI